MFKREYKMANIKFQWDNILFHDNEIIEDKFKSDLGTLLPEEEVEVNVLFKTHIPNRTLNGVITNISGIKLYSFFCSISNSYKIEYHKF